MRLLTPRELGQRAFREGREPCECPFAIGSYLRRLWFRGYREAPSYSHPSSEEAAMADSDHIVDLHLDLTPTRNGSRDKRIRNGIKFGKMMRARAMEIPTWKRELIAHRRAQTIKLKNHRLP